MNQILKKLEREELTGITFIRNYLQLLFDTAYLNAYVWPVVRMGDEVFHEETKGYRDALCQQINKIVLGIVEIPNEKIILLFPEDCEVEFSLKDEDKTGPESIMIQTDLGKSWGVW